MIGWRAGGKVLLAAGPGAVRLDIWYFLIMAPLANAIGFYITFT